MELPQTNCNQPGMKILSRGPIDTGASMGKDFSGIQFPFTFKTAIPISLFGVSFFGPHESSKGPFNYDVSVEIGESYSNHRAGKMTNMMKEQWFKVEKATPGEKFTITFDKAVVVPKDVWTEILFQLEGPKTGFLHANFMFETEITADGVAFDTGVRGSGQLSDIFFKD